MSINLLAKFFLEVFMNNNDKSQPIFSFLSQQIDKLIEQIAVDVRQENTALKQKIIKLEEENLRLLRILYLIQKENSAKNDVLERVNNTNKDKLIN